MQGSQEDRPLPSTFQRWILAARPATLTAAIVPVLVGSAAASGLERFRWGPALGALLGACLIQIATNFVNDVADFEKGADTEARLGPTRVVQAGLLTAAQVRRGIWVTFGLAVLVGLYLTWEGGWPVVAIGVASILSGIAYTSGPYPLGYHGLGDVFVMLFFGFVAVCGTVYVQMLEVPLLAWWASVPVGALATAILVVNNVRDHATDVLAGKRTLAVRFGRKAGEMEYAFLLFLAYTVPVILFLGGMPFTLLLPLLTLPLGLKRFRELRTRTGRPLNETLAGTAKLLGLFGLLFALGLAVGGH